MTNTTRYSFPQISASQAQKEITHNQSLWMIDGLMGCVVETRQDESPPSSYSEGELYLIPDVSAAGGAWGGYEGEIAHYYNSTWYFYPPTEGMRIWVKDEAIELLYNGATWEDFSIDENAFHNDGAGEIHALTEKTALTDNDEFLGENSENSYSKIRVLWSSIKSVLKTYFDTIYILATAKGAASGIASLNSSTKVVEDPANATATATASKIPIADGSAKLDTWISDASTSTKGKIEIATETEVLAGTATSLAVTPAGLAATIALNKAPLASAQGVYLSYASSGSIGIAVPNNDDINFGVNDFSIRAIVALPDWTPAASVVLVTKINATPRVGFLLGVASNRYIYLTIGDGVSTSLTFFSTVTTDSFVDGRAYVIGVSIKRETASSAGSVTFYINGLQFGSPVSISAGTPPTVNYAIQLILFGYITTRYSGILYSLQLYNLHLSAADHYADYISMTAPDHYRWGSQTVITSGTLVTGKTYSIDTYVSGDDFTNVGGTNVSGAVFIATGTTPTTWTNSSSLRRVGATLALLPEGMQPAPGQCLDEANGNHGLQPPSGSSLVRPMSTFELRYTNTWTGSGLAQYIGGAQDILPDGAYITEIIGVITGATVEDIIIGDGSDTDRWVTITTGLATGTVSFTIANHVSDGTNRQMIVDPDASATMSIAWIIRGFIL